MAIGKMRHKVEIQRRVRASDGAGGASSTWETIDKVWAQIVPKSASEGSKGDQIEGRKNYDLNIRYRDDINNSCRILYKGRVFNVTGVVNTMETDKYMVVNMVEGVAV